MSTHNPYEPSVPATKRSEDPSPTLDLDPSFGPERKQDLPAAPESGNDVPQGSIKEIMAWVGTSKRRAKSVLAAESARDDARPSLLTRLERVIKA